MNEVAKRTAGEDVLARQAPHRPGGIAPGEMTKTMMVSVKGDKTKKTDETFFVNLSGATNAQIADDQGKGTILNDDGVSTAGKKASAAVDAAIEQLMFSSPKKR